MASSWVLAFRTLRRHPLRSVLMGLALVIGVVSVTLTDATGEGARQAVRQSFKAMIGALDVLLVQPGGAAERGMANLESSITTLTADDAAAIAESVPNVRAVGMEQYTLGAPIEAGGKNGTTALFGASANWAALRGDSIANGAFYTDADGQSLARVAVLGADVARDYFPGSAAVGQHLRIENIDFEVVGVLAPNGAGPGGVSIDNLVYIPLETARRRVFNRDYLNMLSVKLADPNRWAQTQAAVVALLRSRHGKSGDELDDFRVSSPEAMMARVAHVDTTLRTALMWVGALAMLIGGVVVANLMFAAAVARRTEIATRRAVGASRRDILGQFWAESVLVSTVAAVVGAAIALAIIEVGAGMMRMSLAVSSLTVTSTIGLAVVIGALAGYFPARRAATLSPAQALRDAG